MTALPRPVYDACSLASYCTPALCMPSVSPATVHTSLAFRFPGVRARDGTAECHTLTVSSLPPG